MDCVSAKILALIQVSCMQKKKWRLSSDTITDILFMLFIIARVTFRVIVGYGYLFTYFRYTFFIVILLQLYFSRSIKMNDFMKWSVLFIGVAFGISLVAGHRNNSLDMISRLSGVILEVLLVSLYCYTKRKTNLFFIAFFLSGIVIFSFQITQLSIVAILSTNAKYLTGLRISMTENEQFNITAYNLFIALLSGVYLLKYKIINRTLCLAGLAVISLGSVMTGSRKTFVVGVLLIAVMFMGGKRKFLKIALISITAYILFTLLMQNAVFYNLIGWRLAASVGNDDVSTENRMAFAIDAIWVGFDSIIGVGLDNYRYYNIRGLYAHNNFAELFADLSLLGLVAFYWLHIKTLVTFIKNKTDEYATFWIACIISLMLVDIGQVSYSLFTYLSMISVFPLAAYELRQRNQLSTLSGDN